MHSGTASHDPPKESVAYTCVVAADDLCKNSIKIEKCINPRRLELPDLTVFIFRATRKIV